MFKNKFNVKTMGSFLSLLVIIIIVMLGRVCNTHEKVRSVYKMYVW